MEKKRRTTEKEVTLISQLPLVIYVVDKPQGIAFLFAGA